MGVRHLFFLTPLSRDTQCSRALFSTGLPATWDRHYRAGLHLFDPMLRLATRQAGAFAWPEAFSGDSLSAREWRYMRIAGRYGLARGLGVACYGPFGRSGFLGGAWPGEEPPGEQALIRFGAIGQAAFQRYCALAPFEEDIRPLSEREMEVLHWIGRGKSNNVIAEILEISSSSVDAYVRRIFAKLHVTDRTTAALKAFSHGLIVNAGHEQFVENRIVTGS